MNYTPKGERVVFLFFFCSFCLSIHRRLSSRGTRVTFSRVITLLNASSSNPMLLWILNKWLFMAWDTQAVCSCKYLHVFGALCNHYQLITTTCYSYTSLHRQPFVPKKKKSHLFPPGLSFSDKIKCLLANIQDCSPPTTLPITVHGLQPCTLTHYI